MSGEGILNDAAGLILVDTVLKLGNATEVNLEMLGEFTKAFGRSSVLSVLYGFAMGGLAVWSSN